MKKKRGRKVVKKKVSFLDKVKKFFSPNGKVAPVVLMFVFLALAILLPLVTTGHAPVDMVSGGSSILDKPVSIQLPDAMSWLRACSADTCSWKEVIVFIIVLAIIFVILLDILTLLSIFSTWVSIVIAVGFSIIGVLTNVIRQISIWVITIAAGAGIAAGFIEIIISIVIFVGLVFGSSKIAIWAAKRKAQKEEISAIEGAGTAGAAITGLKMIQKKFKA